VRCCKAILLNILILDERAFALEGFSWLRTSTSEKRKQKAGGLAMLLRRSGARHEVLDTNALSCFKQSLKAECDRSVTTVKPRVGGHSLTSEVLTPSQTLQTRMPKFLHLLFFYFDSPCYFGSFTVMDTPCVFGNIVKFNTGVLFRDYATDRRTASRSVCHGHDSDEVETYCAISSRFNSGVGCVHV
jgi:hypothetical protein